MSGAQIIDLAACVDCGAPPGQPYHRADCLAVPQSRLPCSFCGSLVPMHAEVCHHCKNDPRRHWIPCPDCEGSGAIETSTHGGQYPGDPITCPDCKGHKEVESPCWEDREAALAEIRGGVQ